MKENIFIIDPGNNYGTTTPFLERQIRQIKKGGLSVLIQKVFIFLFKVSGVLCAIPFVIVMRISRPFILVRLGVLDIGRIGGLFPADWYLAECYAGKYKKKYFDVFCFIKSTGVVSNQQWLKMWKRVLRVVPFGKFFRIVDKVNRRLPGFEPHIISMDDIAPTYKKKHKEEETLQCVLSCPKVSIAFTPEEEALGRELLCQLGIPEEKPFICFHARDSAYLNSIFPKRDWSYHDFRDSAIKNYVPAAEKLTQQGYCAVRMGAIVAEKLQCHNRWIIDYATNGKRTDFLDIYLGAKCKFFICSQSGINVIPEIFKRPVVYTNLPALGLISPYVYYGLIIPQKLYFLKEQRFLTFAEIINSEIGTFYSGEQFERLGIELIENTPEEIASVAIEMDGRIKGTWRVTAEDEALQQRFWDIYRPALLKSPSLRIGMEFLRQNQGLLN